jgi:hypothetical protein
MDLGGSFNRFYNNLKTSAAPPPQISAADTIDKLCDRLGNSTLVEDRRAALLGLKGLSRDWKAVSVRLRYSLHLVLMHMCRMSVKQPCRCF